MLQAQLSHEQSRNFDGPLQKMRAKTATRRKELEEQKDKKRALEEEEKVPPLLACSLACSLACYHRVFYTRRGYSHAIRHYTYKQSTEKGEGAHKNTHTHTHTSGGEAKKRKKRHKSCRRDVGNGVDLGGKEKKT